MSNKLNKMIDDTAEYGEPVFDQVTAGLIPLAGSLSDVVKEEPILKIILAVMKLPRSVSDAMFIHKFNKFFTAGELNKKSLEKLNKKLSGKKKARLWKLIFTSIQSHDDEIRSELVGKIIKALAEGDITYEESITMIHASNRANIDNLRYLLQCYLGEPRTMPGYAQQEFVMLGLLGIDQSGLGTYGGGSIQYPLTNFGAKYTGIIYDHPPYPYRPDIKLGKSDLVGCQKNPSENAREVLPIKEVIDKGYWYGEAAIVIRDKDKLLLDGLNPIIKSTPIVAGEYGEKSLSNLTGVDEERFTCVLVRPANPKHISVHYYLLEKEYAKRLVGPGQMAWKDYKEIFRTDMSDELKQLTESIIKHDAIQAGKENK